MSACATFVDDWENANADSELCQQGCHSARAWCAFSIVIAFKFVVMLALAKVTMSDVGHLQ